MNTATYHFYQAQDWAAYKNYWASFSPSFEDFVGLIEEDFLDTFQKYQDSDEIPYLHKIAFDYMLSMVDWEAIAKKIIEE